MATIQQSKEARINSAINVTPMVDVMLVLLIIFMVITPMLNRQDSRVEMAKTRSPIDMADANKADALIVAVMHDGTLFLGNESVTAESLTEKLTERLSNRSDKTVYVRADARAKYGSVVAVADEVCAAGVDELGLLTEQTQRTISY